MRLTARVKKQVFRMCLTVDMRLTTRVYGSKLVYVSYCAILSKRHYLARLHAE